MEDLLEDIKVYLELEQGKNTDYWRDIVTVTNDELSKLRKLDNSQRGWKSNNVKKYIIKSLVNTHYEVQSKNTIIRSLINTHYEVQSKNTIIRSLINTHYEVQSKNTLLGP